MGVESNRCAVCLQVVIKHEGEAVKGSPIHYRAMPELTSIQHTGMEPCAVGSIVEVLVSGNAPPCTVQVAQET